MIPLSWTCVENTCTINNIEPFFTPNFSSGEIVISIFLLILILLQLITLIRDSFKNIKISRRFMGNNTQNGKEFYEI